MAILTDKGFIVRAAKKLLARATSREITILAVHDADISGYDIARTLVDETRTTKGLVVKVIDVGLKVADALAMGLPPERVNVKHNISSKLKARLTPEESEFFKKYRIELNAMTSCQLIDWIESNLAKLGLAKKLIPPDSVLAHEITNKLDTELAVKADEITKEQLEKLLGIDLKQLAQDLLNDIKKPSAEGHKEELEEDMDELPTESWHDWAETKAFELETEVTHEINDLAETRIKELLKRNGEVK
jgi:hypothetical protein